MTEPTKTNEEIGVRRSWLEGLIEYAERTEKLLGENYEDTLKYGLEGLLGYISSAETLLKK